MGHSVATAPGIRAKEPSPGPTSGAHFLQIQTTECHPVKIDGLIKAAHQIDKIRYRPSLVWKISRGYVRALVLR
jgi:hypothetical protein